jgi:Beta/Gamma crystallin
VKRLAMFLGAATLAVGAAGGASAQGILDQLFGGYGQQRGQGSITLWSEPYFRGESRTIYGTEQELGRINFNDRARSVQANGPVILCEDNFFRGRCQRAAGNIPDLRQYGLEGRLSSVRADDGSYGGGYGNDPYGGGYGGGYPNDRDDDQYGGGYGAGYGRVNRDGVEGRTAVFFPRPSIQGRPLASRGQQSADQFCRAAGYRGSIYWNQGERERSAIDIDGRNVDAAVLRDVLCRR